MAKDLTLTHPFRPTYTFQTDPASRDFMCWLLERLPEWEELKEFCDYHGYLYEETLNAEKPIRFYIPVQDLTSPSTLPEKVGEYIEWRDKK